MTDETSESPAAFSVEQVASVLLESTAIRPALGLILGSGLGSLADLIHDPDIFPTSQLPGYPGSTVEGHEGKLIFGELRDVPLVFLQGRVHLYEGHTLERLLTPVRLLAELGIERLIVTNAAGGIRDDFRPGTLMWITDHIDYSFEPDRRSGRPVRTAATPYDRRWQMRAREISEGIGVDTKEGIYIWTRGPSYETPAEIRAFRTLGADAVGMSTVPEVREAARLGIRVLGLSTITNLAAGLSSTPLNHEEVLETGRRVQENLQRLILHLVGDLAETTDQYGSADGA